MFKLRIVQADYGDSFILGYGSAADPRWILVDGGPEGVYGDHLRGQLERLANDGARLELVVVSHVDTDHVTGLNDLFAELAQQAGDGEDPLIEVGGLWYNSFGRTLDQGSGLAGRLQAAMTGVNAVASPLAARSVNGIEDGARLRLRALQLQLPINAGFANELVRVEGAAGALQLENLTVRVVGPTQANLDELQADWEEWLEEHEEAFATADPKLLANADQSVPNLSSIMLHLEAGGRTLLLTGDGRSDHLLKGLAAAGLLDPQGRLHVDVLKVAHHGSDRNATRTFHRKVTADTYVISANGHPDNPDLATLIWIVETAHEVGRPIRIMATNDTPALRKLPQEYPPAEYRYTLDIMPPHYSYWDLDLDGS